MTDLQHSSSTHHWNKAKFCKNWKLTGHVGSAGPGAVTIWSKWIEKIHENVGERHWDHEQNISFELSHGRVGANNTKDSSFLLMILVKAKKTVMSHIRVGGVNVLAWMEWMSEAFARDCQVNMWMDKTSLLLVPLNERQITHLICARLKYDLYDFFRGVLGPASCSFSCIKGPKTSLKKSYRSYFRRAQIRYE